jgi:hypothetical protein
MDEKSNKTWFFFADSVIRFWREVETSLVVDYMHRKSLKR